MSRVAPPIQMTQPPLGDDAVAPALGDGLPDDDAPVNDFASAMQAADQADMPNAALPSAAVASGGAPAVVTSLAPGAAAAPRHERRLPEEADDDRRPVDPVAQAPSMQPSPLWQALLTQNLPAQTQTRSATAETAAAPVQDAASTQRALSMPVAQIKALAEQAAELAPSRELPMPALNAAALSSPPAHAAEAGKAAEGFSLALPAAQPESWSGKLQAALGERLQVLSSQNMDRATLRLDPPSLGTLEIAIRHQAGALTVELTASHGEVVRQLQNIGDALRQDLGARQYTQVAVEVKEGMPSGHGQGGRHGREPQREEPSRALAQDGWTQADGFSLD